MQKCTISVVVVAFVFSTCLSALAASSEFEIRSYRFRADHKKNFDRLVLEFAKPSGFADPSLRVTPNTGTGETLIQLPSATLIGAIPEAAINDSYYGSSRFLGPITIATDNPQGGFSIKAVGKNPDTKVEALWLSNPNRLVIDAYPTNSSRASSAGREDRRIASHSNTRRSDDEDKFVCFPAISRVGLKVKFQGRYQSKKAYNPIPVNLHSSPRNTPEMDSIICYPKTAQVNPSFAFEAELEVFANEEIQQLPAQQAQQIQSAQPVQTAQQIQPVQQVQPTQQVQPAQQMLQPDNRLLSSPPGFGQPGQLLAEPPSFGEEQKGLPLPTGGINPPMMSPEALQKGLTPPTSLLGPPPGA